MVFPSQGNNLNMSESYSKYWKESWVGLQVGHRGLGNSYCNQPKTRANIKENTIASFKGAADNGADMVEFDVQLSKDKVPVIYHDFDTTISLKRKEKYEDADLLIVPLKDLTIHRLQ